ncbi:MAG TPA: MoaD/ThiS family protein [Dehalococcoidia bacterium]|jgi:molybdopterin converting factor small subunit
MARVHLPALLRPLAGGASSVEASGATLRAVIDDLDRQFPGLGERIVDAGEIRPDVMVAIDADEVRDLDAPIAPGSEVHILPAIAGG